MLHKIFHSNKIMWNYVCLQTSSNSSSKSHNNAFHSYSCLVSVPTQEILLLFYYYFYFLFIFALSYALDILTPGVRYICSPNEGKICNKNKTHMLLDPQNNINSILSTSACLNNSFVYSFLSFTSPRMVLAKNFFDYFT